VFDIKMTSLKIEFEMGFVSKDKLTKAPGD